MTFVTALLAGALMLGSPSEPTEVPDSSLRTGPDCDYLWDCEIYGNVMSSLTSPNVTLHRYGVDTTDVTSFIPIVRSGRWSLAADAAIMLARYGRTDAVPAVQNRYRRHVSQGQDQYSQARSLLEPLYVLDKSAAAAAARATADSLVALGQIDDIRYNMAFRVLLAAADTSQLETLIEASRSDPIHLRDLALIPSRVPAVYPRFERALLDLHEDSDLSIRQVVRASLDALYGPGHRDTPLPPGVYFSEAVWEALRGVATEPGPFDDRLFAVKHLVRYADLGGAAYLTPAESATALGALLSDPAATEAQRRAVVEEALDLGRIETWRVVERAADGAFGAEAQAHAQSLLPDPPDPVTLRKPQAQENGSGGFCTTAGG